MKKRKFHQIKKFFKKFQKLKKIKNLFKLIKITQKIYLLFISHQKLKLMLNFIKFSLSKLFFSLEVKSMKKILNAKDISQKSSKRTIF